MVDTFPKTPGMTPQPIKAYGLTPVWTEPLIYTSSVTNSTAAGNLCLNPFAHEQTPLGFTESSLLYLIFSV